ncbi:hypothetical protein CPB83DRAFT_778658, partial [Crepidotus variabilis]
IATSPSFRTGVLPKPELTRHLRCVCIDEARCLSPWCGSSRRDYAELGVLRGRLPSHICMVVVSATLPNHILENIRAQYHITKDAVTNAVAKDRSKCLTFMQSSHESKADLRFLILDGANTLEDVPTTLV